MFETPFLDWQREQLVLQVTYGNPASEFVSDMAFSTGSNRLSMPGVDCLHEVVPLCSKAMCISCIGSMHEVG